MKSSTDRILTTHVGSLPRRRRDRRCCSRAIMASPTIRGFRPHRPGGRRRRGRAPDRGRARHRQRRRARQGRLFDLHARAADRLRRRRPAQAGPRSRALPELRANRAIMGSQEFIRAACIGPVRLRTLSRATTTSAAFACRARGNRRVAGFMNAASPGLITAFQPNQYYPQPRGLSRRSRRCDAARI